MKFIKFKLVSVFILSFFIISPYASFADVITMNSGEVINGTLIRFSHYVSEIYFRGIMKSIDSKNITSISTSNPVTIVLNSGEKVIGSMQLTNKDIIVQSLHFGGISLAVNEVASISTVVSEKDMSSLNNTSSQSNGTPSDFQIEAEKDVPPMDYLRGSTVLRKPGETEVALTLSYDRGRYDNPVISTLMGVIANETRYRFMADLSFTVGITERLEGWVNVPYTWMRLERVEGIYKDKSIDNGIGDVSFGLRYLALGEGTYYPSVTLTLDGIAPTGSDPYAADPFDAAVAMGTGHWSIRPGVSFVTTSDPLIFFYGINYKYNFSANYNDTKWKRGDSIGYYGGVGFAVNDRASLSAKMLGEYQFESSSDGQQRYGTSRNPLSLSFALSYRTDGKFILSPFVNIGANDDSPDFTMGVTCAKTF